MHCNVCGEKKEFKHVSCSEDRLFKVSGEFDLWKCGQCGAVSVDPQLSGNALMKHYPDSYYGNYTQYYESLREKKGFLNKVKSFLKFGTLNQFFGYGKKHWWQVFLFPLYYEFAQYPKFVKGGKLLEIGSGTGGFLKLMEEIGWKVYGCDIASIACETTKKMGLKNISCGAFEKIAYPEKEFDAIVSYHVMEHFSDPHAIIQKCYEILKPGGELVISLPNSGGLPAKIFGKNWFGYHVPRHLISYNRKNLSRVLKEHNFSIERVVTNSSLGSVVESFELMCNREWRSFRFLHKLARVLKFVFDPFADVLRTGDQLIVRARRL